MRKDQEGALGIDEYVSLIVVILVFVFMLIGLSGMVRVGDARSDGQQVADFVGRQYRDQGCLTPESAAMAKEMMGLLKMPVDNLSIEGLSVTPLPYGESKMLVINYKFYALNDPKFYNMVSAKDIKIPMPIYSQYSPQLAGKVSTCVTSIN